MNIPAIRPIFCQHHANSSKNTTNASELKSNALTNNSVSFCGISGEDAVAKIREVAEAHTYSKDRSWFQSKRSKDSYAIVARTVDVLVTDKNAAEVRKYLETAFKKDKPSWMYENLTDAIFEESSGTYRILYPESIENISSYEPSGNSLSDYYSGGRD